jgi:hypothetical protein
VKNSSGSFAENSAPFGRSEGFVADDPRWLGITNRERIVGTQNHPVRACDIAQKTRPQTLVNDLPSKLSSVQVKLLDLGYQLRPHPMHAAEHQGESRSGRCAVAETPTASITPPKAGGTRNVSIR